MTGSGSGQAPRVTIRRLVELPEAERAFQPRRMTSTAELARRNAALLALMAPAVETLEAWVPEGARAGLRDRAEVALEGFDDLHDRRPVADNRGGSGFNDSLWLYVVARAFAPRLVIESGTHKGHSAWLFRQACPDAEIHSFDISWDYLKHREAGVSYHRHDWSEADHNFSNTAESLVFFDDHMSHARRIEEAWERGFRLLLLDDNFPAHQLHATGGPPLPSLAMLLDPALRDGQALAWTRNGKAYSTVFREAEATRARGLVAGHLVLPELAPVTAQPPGSRLTAVKLVE